jgi:hypothetical protein
LGFHQALLWYKKADRETAKFNGFLRMYFPKSGTLCQLKSAEADASPTPCVARRAHTLGMLASRALRCERLGHIGE